MTDPTTGATATETPATADAPRTDELVRVISAVTDAPAGTLTGASRFDELDNWSSLAALRLLTAVEDAFGVRLNLRAYLATETVDGLARMIATGPTGGRS
ncbi:acyl carrier protein [Streptomyces sp. NPDC059262]|uniref:acyl carrier protein n=1 Tax=Streptomyces sp. NPDC059262 TaxID=3346797 RepID=UPI0036A3171D